MIGLVLAALGLALGLLVARRRRPLPRARNSAWVGQRIAEGSSAEVLARAERWEQRRRDAREREARAWAELEQATAEADALKRGRPALSESLEGLAAVDHIRATQARQAEIAGIPLLAPPGYQW